MPFYLKADEFKEQNVCNHDYIKVNTSSMDENQASQFIDLQDKAIREITQDINVLTKEGLKNTTIDLDFVLIYRGESLIGYGYGFDDPDLSKSYYIDTIYIHKSHRNNGLGRLILNELISRNIEKYKIFRGITQPTNEKTIKLLQEFGFKYKDSWQTYRA